MPGAEEFAPSVTGMWLPPERTFSSLSHDGRFTPEHVRHLQISLERDLASGVTVSLRGFDQRVDNQLIEIFDAVPGRAEARAWPLLRCDRQATSRRAAGARR